MSGSSPCGSGESKSVSKYVCVCVLCPRIDPLRFLAGCRRRRLNQGLVVALGFFSLLDRACFCIIFFGLWVDALFSSLPFCYQYQCNCLPGKIHSRNNLLCAEPVERLPVPPCRRGLTYAQGPHVTYGKNFLGACRCMTTGTALLENNEASAKLTTANGGTFTSSSARLSSQSRCSMLDR